MTVAIVAIVWGGSAAEAHVPRQIHEPVVKVTRYRGSLPVHFLQFQNYWRNLDPVVRR
jgi:hypothetical protein